MAFACHLFATYLISHYFQFIFSPLLCSIKSFSSPPSFLVIALSLHSSSFDRPSKADSWRIYLFPRSFQIVERFIRLLKGVLHFYHSLKHSDL